MVMPHPTTIQGPTGTDTPASVLNGGILHRLAPFNVVWTDRVELESYLSNRPELTVLLEGICARLRKVFGLQAELSLEYYKDPEQHDEYPILYVRQAKYEAGILTQIETAVSAFMPQLEDASGHLLVTTDFRRPRG
jgi:hypothetical protein